MFKMISDNEAYIKCPECRDEYIITLSDDEASAIRRFVSGELKIQEALPYRDRSVRESFLSGICVECWNRMFGIEAVRAMGAYFDIDNSFAGDSASSYLVVIPTYEDSLVTAKVYADSAGQALNEAAASLIGIAPIKACRIVDYLDDRANGYDEEMTELPCGYAVIKEGTSVFRLSEEPIQ